MRAWRIVRRVVVFALVLTLALAGTLALPVKQWRTGEPAVPLPPLQPGKVFQPAHARVWIDTDAACGHGERTDPDDCLALLLLARAQNIRVIGISTVFGNAPIEVTDATTRALMARLHDGAQGRVPVHRGAAQALERGDAIALTPAASALQVALAAGPLTVVALGPATNLVVALRERPDLAARVTRLIVVMGRRRGHLFHPVEGGTARSFFGHGPVFTDFNFAQDPEAVRFLLGMRLPMTLVPYEATRGLVVDEATLAALVARGGAAAEIARASRPWLAYWREDIGRPGFSPFDAVAAAYAIDSSLLRCADTEATIGRDAGLLGLFGSEGLFVLGSGERGPALQTGARVTYCPGVSQRTKPWLEARLAGRPDPPAPLVTAREELPAGRGNP